MKKYQKRRRLLIRNGLGLLAGFTSIAKGGMAQHIKGNIPSTCLNMSFINECRAVKECWLKTFEQKPLEYLNDLYMGFAGEQGIQQQVLDEFNANSVMFVKGLVLSKTEAALICFFYDSSLEQLKPLMPAIS